jgi:tetratricopeptide (TPR) repeat protein
MKFILPILLIVITFPLCMCNNKKKINNRDDVFFYENKDIKDTFARRMLNEGVKLAEQGEYHKCQSFLGRADSAYPNSPKIITTIGNCIMQTIEGDSAVYYYIRAIKLDSNYIPAYINYGYLLNITYRSQKAIEILQLGLKHKSTFLPSRQTLYYNLACSYSNLNQYRKALNLLDSAILTTKPSQRLLERIIELRTTLQKKL